MKGTDGMNPNSDHPGEQDASAQPLSDGTEHEFPIVGIGASAGGVAAFEQLFRSMPIDSGMAFVVIQHLSTPHPSILPEIIQRFTLMPVMQVTDGIEVEPNRVYVIPPGSDLALKDGRLVLLKPETGRGGRLPIDRFFRSLAQVQGERAIGVVLSGTLSDGSLGLKSIKAEGGLTIAQEPATAEFADMPRNAIATQEVDFVVPPEKMGELILKVIHHQVVDNYPRLAREFQTPVGGVQRLYYLLRSKTGHDFSLYKQNTLLRRIERRMKVCLVKDLDEYIDRLQQQPEEVEALFQEMLINVTHFFRDPEAFGALAEKVIHPLILTKQATQAPLRVWSSACSSGEEAYSLAIAIQEQLENLNATCKVLIYATDLDEQAINSARKGFYTEGSLENVSPERLQRFFTPHDQVYQVKKGLRDMVVFSTQDLVSDPPFSKMDLVSCRNLLIYLEQELQSQLMQQFHYALNPEGFLFLGNSESLGSNGELFSVVDRKHKLYRRKEAVPQHRNRLKSRFLSRDTFAAEPYSAPTRQVSGGLGSWTEKLLLEFHTPACVVLDPQHNILLIHGRTGKYLEPVAGEVSNNLLRMAREGLKTELATALHAAVARQETVRRLGLQVKTNGDYQPINLTVQPVKGPAGYGDLVLVVFEEAELPAGEKAAQGTAAIRKKSRATKLEQELKEKDDYLHTIIDELEQTNQDLKSANEELQSSNEEMQSTNEELETSKEELQSINEELQTINAELQTKNDELTRLNNDVYNLMAATEIGMIFVDLELQLRRFTPAIQHIYSFLPSDVGRPIEHFVSRLEYDHLVDDIHQVLNTLISREVEVQAKDGAWYQIQILPYRTIDNVVDGAVITFVDISAQKQGDELRRLGAVVRDSNDAVTLQDFSGQILAWNRGAARLYGWSEAESLTMNTLDLTPEARQAEMQALYQRLSRGEPVRSFETQRRTRDGRILEVWLTLTTLVNNAGQPAGIATTERDISDRKHTSQILAFENRAVKAANQWLKTLLDGTQPDLFEACRILVETAGYRLAWIGQAADGPALTLTPAAWFGLEEAAVKAQLRPRMELIESTLSSGSPRVVRQDPTDPAQKPWRRDAKKHGYGSFLIIPLIHQDDRRGVLVVYAAEPEAFIDLEVAALSQLADSLEQAASLQGPAAKKRDESR
jgi:two-component system, chemotaxis family, CheB/CheR fusion protein